MTIKHLVLSGGGYKGLYSIGALKHLYEKKFYNIDDIENIYGTSVGAIIYWSRIMLKVKFSRYM